MAHLPIAKVFRQVAIRENKVAKTQFLFLKELWLSYFYANGALSSTKRILSWCAFALRLKKTRGRSAF